MENPKNITYRPFNDWTAFKNAVLGKSTTPDASRFSHISDNGGWSGTATWDENVTMLTSGWVSKATEIKAKAERMRTRISKHIQRPRWVYAEDGASWDLARVLEGESECYWHRKQVRSLRTGSRVVKIGVSVSASAGVSDKVLVTKGTALATLSMCLDYAGIQTEITVFDTAGSGSGPNYGSYLNAYVISVVLKRAGQAVDFPLAAYALCSAAMLRRSMFSIEETEPEDIRACFEFMPHGGYGASIPIPSPYRNGFDILIDSASLDMADSAPQWKSEQAAEEFVLDQLKAQGVTISTGTTGD